MDTTIVVSVIAAASGVIVAAVSFLLTKKREREADWRKYKYEQYKEFVVSISGIVAGDSTPEGNRAFARACNTLHLIGSKGVLVALHAYQDEVAPSNPSHSATKESAMLSKLVWEVRKDIEIPGTRQSSDFSVQLWCSGTNPKNNR
ncbi:MAG: hypothetical protein ABSB60_00715 [Terracidiphilus sp.]|jgi:hypothetical protein